MANMGSIKAQKMAMKVSESIRGKKSRSYGEIAVEVGYSPNTAKKPKLITSTKAYKVALFTENAPLLAGLQKEINEIKSAMAMKDKTQEDYRVLASSLDTLIKNYQLLSGGATERQVFVLPSELLNRNEIKATNDPKLLENGSVEP